MVVSAELTDDKVENLFAWVPLRAEVAKDVLQGVSQYVYLLSGVSVVSCCSGRCACDQKKQILQRPEGALETLDDAAALSQESSGVWMRRACAGV